MKLVFDIQSYWLCGTGQSERGSADETANRTSNGLPFIPGKTIKGVMKHALKEWEGLMGDCEENDRQLSEQLFGGGPDDEERSAKGALRVGSAQLGKAESVILSQQSNRALVNELYKSVSSTAVDHKTGSAKKRSLRTIEVVVPLRLEAELEWVAAGDCRDEIPADWAKTLSDALSLIQNIGAHRNRGFGRCTVSLEGV